MVRKVNLEVLFVEVEKFFYKNKGKFFDIELIFLDWLKEDKKKFILFDGLNLVKLVFRDGVKFEVLVKFVVKKLNFFLKKLLDVVVVFLVVVIFLKRMLFNVILRKLSLYYVNNEEEDEFKLWLKCNLILKMRNDRENERFSDMMLLRKLELVSVNVEEDKVLSDGLILEEGE